MHTTVLKKLPTTTTTVGVVYNMRGALSYNSALACVLKLLRCAKRCSALALQNL